MKLATPNRKRGCDALPQQGERTALAARAAATPAPGRRRSVAAFTLAEVLVAMVFMAIVIPTAVEVLSISSRAGEVAARKGVAARIADRVLNESIVTTNWVNGTQNGTISEGALDFKWTLTTQNWPPNSQAVLAPVSGLSSQAPMLLLTAKVDYLAQGRDYSVTLGTLVNYPNQPAATTMTMR